MSVIPSSPAGSTGRLPRRRDRARLRRAGAAIVRQDAGFTIMEVLVAMVIGIVVTGRPVRDPRSLAAPDVRITDRVQATQLGRTAMTKIVDELHSGCLAREFAPVKAAAVPRNCASRPASAKKRCSNPPKSSNTGSSGTEKNRAS